MAKSDEVVARSDTDLASGRIGYERKLVWVEVAVVVHRAAIVAFAVSVAVAIAGVVADP